MLQQGAAGKSWTVVQQWQFMKKAFKAVNGILTDKDRRSTHEEMVCMK